MNEKIIQEARSWLGTPFIIQGRLKNVGCDCLGLIVGIAHNLQAKSKSGKLLSSYAIPNYALHTDGTELEHTLDTVLESSEMEYGSIALLSFDSNPQHLGVICPHPHYAFGLIHADLKAKKVVEHGLSDEYIEKIKKTYKFCE